jgi:anti-sigma28 factor (negative regulator of flagellin synthesis)
MEISQLNPISPRPQVGANNGSLKSAARQAYETPRIARTGDQVELSDRAMLLSRLRELPSVRQGLIDQVRTAIERGEYDTPEKVDAAIEKMIAEHRDAL